MWDASATMIDVPLENAINMRSVWTTWLQFWGKQHLLNRTQFGSVAFDENTLMFSFSAIFWMCSTASNGFNWTGKKKKGARWSLVKLAMLKLMCFVCVCVTLWRNLFNCFVTPAESTSKSIHTIFINSQTKTMYKNQSHSLYLFKIVFYLIKF